MSELLAHVGLPQKQKPRSLQAPHRLWNVILFSAGYYAGGVVGLLFKFPPSGITVIWPSTAVLLTALLLTQPRYWWMYVLAVVPTHLHLVMNFQQPAPPVVVALCQVASNCVEVVLAGFVVRRVLGVPVRFEGFRKMVAFILLVGIGTTVVACVMAVSLFMLTGWATDFWLTLRQRVLAGMFPILTIPPLILLTRTGELAGSQPALRRSYAEFGVLIIGLLATGITVWGWGSSGPAIVQGLLLAPLPLLLWAAVRLGLGALNASLLVVAGVALVNGYLGRGPFATQSAPENVLSLQIFLIALSIPLMLLAVLVDEEHRVEESLKQSEARMAIAAASTDTGLWQYDVSSGHLWATEHCRSMFGLAANSPLTPDAFLDTVHPSDRAVAVVAMQAASHASEPAKQREFRIAYPDGRPRWYVSTASTEFDRNGRPLRVSGIFRDITPRKKAEQEAEQLEKALRASAEELARVNRETTMGAMAASIAHEINQPLSALVTNGGIGLRLLAKRESDLDEVREVLKCIIDDGHRASHIIASIRAMFRRTPRERSPVNIPDLVSEVLAPVQGKLDSHSVSLQVELSQELPNVLADRVQLQQVLLNLIINAIEAMSSVQNSERKLLVKAERHGSRDVLITVEDSGPGVGPKDVDHIFDAFFTTKPHGMGLGLSICQSIIESHRGRLWASQRLPHGAVFYVQLPGAVTGSE
jgi:PAS domain S-box-containing protein